jgi:hypothetical protein
MTPDATTTAPESPETPARWVSVVQASAALNVSEKTLLRRIKGGKIKAEKAPLPAGGVAWRVRLDSAMDSEQDTERTIAPEPERTQNKRENRAMDNGKDSAPELSFPRAGTGKDNDKNELLAHLKSENLFLRGLVEQRDRDAAEMRAALRKALDSAPRQITAGTPAPDDEPARIEAQGPQNRGGRGREGGDQNGPQITTERDDGAVTYASIADDLESQGI